jgi:hypothetical protein
VCDTGLRVSNEQSLAVRHRWWVNGVSDRDPERGNYEYPGQRHPPIES